MEEPSDALDESEARNDEIEKLKKQLESAKDNEITELKNRIEHLVRLNTIHETRVVELQYRLESQAKFGLYFLGGLLIIGCLAFVFS